jgi:type II secretory pathway pseudopilin PulG
VIVALMIVTALVMVASENWTSGVQTVIEHSKNVL